MTLPWSWFPLKPTKCSPHPVLLPTSRHLSCKLQIYPQLPNFLSPVHVPCWLLPELMVGYFKLFVLAAGRKLKALTPPRPPWPRQMTTLGTKCTPWHTVWEYMQARHTAGTPEQGAPTNRVNVERACAECYSKSVRPHLPTSTASLMPAFPSEARGRVSRHLFKSRNFRPFSMTAAFLVTAKHCLRWNKPLPLF